MRRPLLVALFVITAIVPAHEDVFSATPSAAARARTRPTPRDSIAVRYRGAAERLIGAALASDHAYQRLMQLCDGIGHRLSGSASLERAVQWAAAAMREDGLERVRLQPVKVPHWVRGQESAEMVSPGPQKLSILGLGRSVGTPPGGITADVIAVESFDELHALPAETVRGKIVLYDVPFTRYGETVRYRSHGAKRAAARGAAAVLVRSVGPVSLRTPHTGAMATYVDSFPRIPGAAVTIEDALMMRRLLNRGQRVRVRLKMEADTLPHALSHNVIGELRGRERPDEIVVVGGHLDSWDVGPVGFGFKAYRLGTDSTDKARTALAVERAQAIRPLLSGLGADRIDDTGGGTDIGPLMKRGVPGVAHQTVMEHYFDWHHTPADMVDKVDPVELRKNVAALAVMIYVLAEMPGTLLDGASDE